MKIYNTFTRKKEELETKRAGIYVCGPTVYDEPHIGHARSAFIFDFIVKYLRFKGTKVKFVRNITDVDDKIIERARDESGDNPLNEKVKSIAGRYLKRYHEDMDVLNLRRPDEEPKATETIDDMIKFITILLKKGFAYESDGSVYFNVRKFKEYGKLSGQSLDQMEEGVRVTLDKNKKDPLDFVLWKRSKDDEPSWHSPWGKGRPGWHIECSVMSTKFLGKDFLIHGGGLDLIFPHHENEIAQTICAGKKNAKFWIHNGLLTIEGSKMSKSLGNYVSVRDFMDKFSDPDLLKLLFLSSHYRHPVDYTEEKIKEMAKMKERLSIFMSKVAEKTSAIQKKSGPKNIEELKNLKDEFTEAMDDDFNTPRALAAIFEIVTFGNAFMNRGDLISARKAADTLKDLCNILGIDLEKMLTLEMDLEREVKKLIEEREYARQKKDFKRADKIRGLLNDKGIILEDGKEGTLWRKKI